MASGENLRVEKAVLGFINTANQTVVNQLKKKSAAEFTEDAAAALQGRRTTGTMGQNMKSGLGGQFRLLQVQYNPATLRLSVGGQDTKMENAQAPGSTEVIHQKTQPADATLSMDLMITGETAEIQVNGLLGMLGDELTRRVIFCWGNMAFPGEVTAISASYTMFSPEGKPIMAKVSITINQESQAESTYWTKAFDKLFSNRKNGWKIT